MDLLALGMPGPLELGLILTMFILIFGLGKLPKIGSQLGAAMRGFKKGVQGIEEVKAETIAAVETPVETPVEVVETEVVSA